MHCILRLCEERMHKGDENAYTYLDVAVFDEWVCKYGDDTYYVLYDQMTK